MRDPKRVPVLLLTVAAAAMVAAQGCWLLKANPTPPVNPLVPTIVGMVSGFELTPTATIYKLADGRTVAEVYADKDLLSAGGSYAPGNLLLARPTAPKFLGFMSPIGEQHPGCWEAEGLAMAVWDDDGSLLVGGVELPKAPGFHDDAISEVIDGRKLWTREANVVWSICVNVTGQVEWIHSPYKENLSHT